MLEFSRKALAILSLCVCVSNLAVDKSLGYYNQILVVVVVAVAVVVVVAVVVAVGTHFMPCWKTELRRVLQMMRSAHCTTTMLAKKAVWHVNSTTFRCS